MQNWVRMVTTQPHVYAGRQLACGDEFDCEPQHVHVMTVLGRAHKKEDGAPAVVETSAQPQTYATRDMVAGVKQRRRRDAQ